MSDTNTWNIQISGEQPPPDEIPWVVIGAGVVGALVIVSAVALKRRAQ